MSAESEIRASDDRDSHIVSPLGKQIILMGEIAYLLSHSPAHLGYTVADLMRFFLVPVRLDQFRIYRTKGRPVGFVAWAYLSREIAAQYAIGNYELQTKDWRSGQEVWFVEFIVPFGHARRIIDDMREDSFAEACVHYLRRRDGSARVLKIYGAKHPLSRRRSTTTMEPTLEENQIQTSCGSRSK